MYYFILIYYLFGPAWVFIAARGLSLVAERGLPHSFSLCGLSYRGAQSLGTQASVVVAQALISCGSRA